MKYKFVLIFVLLSFPAFAYLTPGGKNDSNEDTWVTKDGKPVPNTDNIKSIKGFGGMLIVTPDKDWKEKWDTSPETIPKFSTATELHYGEQLAILLFFTNPKTNASGEINVRCSIRTKRPDGTYSLDLKDIDCGSGKLVGDPKNIRLAPVSLMFVAEKDDPPGEWIVDVVIEDKIRGVKIPLKTSFMLLKKDKK